MRNPTQQQAIFKQFVKAGFPPMLEYAAAAYAKGDNLRGNAFAKAALGGPNTPAGGKGAVSSQGATAFPSPVAAANTLAGPAPLSLPTGQGIDLGAVVQQGFGSSLGGNEQDARAKALRSRLIANTLQLNGGDQAGAIANADADIASLQQGAGWVPGRYMSVPMAGGGLQYAFDNTNGNPAWPGAPSSQSIEPGPPPSPAGNGTDTGQSSRTLAPDPRAAGLGNAVMGVAGRVSAAADAMLFRSVVYPTMAVGPAYPDSSVRQYYTIRTNTILPEISASAVIFPGATIKQKQVLDDYLKQAERGDSNDPELAGRQALVIQDSFDLGVRTALMKLAGKLGPDEGDTYTAGSLDANTMVSGNGWLFKIRPPTYPGGPVQVVAARQTFLDHGAPQNKWENLDDPNNPAAQLQAGVKIDEQYAADYNEALRATRNYIQAGCIADERYYKRRQSIALGQSEGRLALASQQAGSGDRALQSKPEGPGLSSQTQLTGDSAPEQPVALPPSHGVDDPYDEADFQAGLKAGLTDQAALAVAKANYRKKTTAAENLEKNKTGTNDLADLDPRTGIVNSDVGPLVQVDSDRNARGLDQPASNEETLSQQSSEPYGSVDKENKKGTNESATSQPASKKQPPAKQRRAKKSVIKNYRKTFFEAYPHLKGKVYVHHRIEQQILEKYPGLFTKEEIHYLENLRGIPREINRDLHLSKIRIEFNDFYRDNPNATKNQIIQKVNEIDKKYGHRFNPPIGGRSQ